MKQNYIIFKLIKLPPCPVRNLPYVQYAYISTNNIDIVWNRATRNRHDTVNDIRTLISNFGVSPQFEIASNAQFQFHFVHLTKCLTAYDQPV